jgi:hypothetical protein
VCGCLYQEGGGRDGRKRRNKWKACREKYIDAEGDAKSVCDGEDEVKSDGMGMHKVTVKRMMIRGASVNVSRLLNTRQRIWRGKMTRYGSETNVVQGT